MPDKFDCGPLVLDPQLEPNEFQVAIQREAERRVRFIMQNRERLLEAWIAETGLLPSESELVEQNFHDGSTVVFIRRRDVEDG